jgi:DNA-binding phage protein
MKTLQTFRAELLADSATCAAYLDDALTEGTAAFIRALRHVAEAHGLALPDGDDLPLSDVVVALRAAGLRLSVVQSAA